MPLPSRTTLTFPQGFSYGLIDTLNKHFQNTLGITRARSSGLQAAYFGAYPLASLGHANWILRKFGFKPCFIWGLCIYGIGCLVTWPCLVYRSFGGFCAATFIIGNGLGSLETAANPYITSKCDTGMSRIWSDSIQFVDHLGILKSGSTSVRLLMASAPLSLLCWQATYFLTIPLILRTHSNRCSGCILPLPALFSSWLWYSSCMSLLRAAEYTIH